MIDATIYNWKELARSYSIDAKDQDSFLDRFLDVPSEDIISRLDSLDGSYSIAIEKDGMTITTGVRVN